MVLRETKEAAVTFGLSQGRSLSSPVDWRTVKRIFKLEALLSLTRTRKEKHDHASNITLTSLVMTAWGKWCWRQNVRFRRSMVSGRILKCQYVRANMAADECQDLSLGLIPFLPTSPDSVLATQRPTKSTPTLHRADLSTLAFPALPNDAVPSTSCKPSPEHVATLPLSSRLVLCANPACIVRLAGGMGSVHISGEWR